MVISVECSRCGKDLHFCMREWNSTIEVDPCESCVEEAEKTEYKNGYDAGEYAGYDDGFGTGFSEGRSEGYIEGCEVGREVGYDEGVASVET